MFRNLKLSRQHLPCSLLILQVEREDGDDRLRQTWRERHSLQAQDHHCRLFCLLSPPGLCKVVGLSTNFFIMFAWLFRFDKWNIKLIILPPLQVPGYLWSSECVPLGGHGPYQVRTACFSIKSLLFVPESGFFYLTPLLFIRYFLLLEMLTLTSQKPYLPIFSLKLVLVFSFLSVFLIFLFILFFLDYFLYLSNFHFVLPKNDFRQLPLSRLGAGKSSQNINTFLRRIRFATVVPTSVRCIADFCTLF